MAWNCIAQSVIGANHKRKGLPLQDSLMTMVDRDNLYVALADGHGSGLCFRSDVGSSLAVLSAIEIVKHQSRNIFRLKTSEEREKACKNLLPAIAAHWARKVLDNLKERPFSSSELDSLNGEHRKRLSTNALLAYGSTLCLTVLNKNLVFGFSLGDSDVLIKKSDAIELFNEHENKQGEETDSLCQYSSISNAKYFEYDSNLLDCFVISTDGYRNSFESDDDFKSVVNDLHTYLNENGPNKLKLNLSKWLKETSAEGSGDDISACFLYS